MAMVEQKQDLVKKSFFKQIIINENIVEQWYFDSLDNPTIGIGFELNQFINELKQSNEYQKKKFAQFILTQYDLAKLGFEKTFSELAKDYLAKLDFNGFQKTFSKLSKDQKSKYLKTLPKMSKEIALQILEEFFYPKYLNYTKQFCVDVGIKFDYLSVTRKSVLLDLIFNMGAPRLKQFGETIKYFKSDDYFLAAKNLLMSQYAITVGFRAMTNALRIATDIDFTKTDSQLAQLIGMNDSQYSKTIQECSSDDNKKKKILQIFENGYQQFESLNKKGKKQK